MNKPRLSPKTIADLLHNICKGFSAMLYTDHQLCEKLNEQLPIELKVCYRTFQRYKAAAMQHGDQYAVDKYSPLYDDLYYAFFEVNMRQKEQLLRLMMDAEGSKWQRYKWLLEKKFPEFNQGCIMENFRRENSYLDEDYPMYSTRKTKQAPLVDIALVEDEKASAKSAGNTAPKPAPDHAVRETEMDSQPQPTAPVQTSSSGTNNNPEKRVTKHHPPFVNAFNIDKKQKQKNGLKLLRTA